MSIEQEPSSGCVACGMTWSGPEFIKVFDHSCPGKPPAGTPSPLHPSMSGPKRWMTATGVELTVSASNPAWSYVGRPERPKLRLLPGGQ